MLRLRHHMRDSFRHSIATPDQAPVFLLLPVGTGVQRNRNAVEIAGGKWLEAKGRGEGIRAARLPVS